MSFCFDSTSKLSKVYYICTMHALVFILTHIWNESFRQGFNWVIRILINVGLRIFLSRSKELEEMMKLLKPIKEWRSKMKHVQHE